MYKTCEVNCGRLLEEKMYEKLVTAFSVSIYQESDLTRMYGWSSSGIDFLIDFDNDIAIMLQTKYRGTRRRETHSVKNFLKSLDHVSNCVKKRNILSFWISKLHPFQDNEELMSSYGVKCISNYKSMDELIEMTINEIKKYLNNKMS